MCALAGCDHVLGLTRVAVMADADLVDAAVTCPPSYTLDTNAHSAYRVIATGDGHFDHAANACKSDQTSDITGYTHLVVIDSAEEHTELAALAAGKPAWVGMHNRTTPPTYQWITNEPVPVDGYWDVAAGEPDNISTEHCAIMKANGLLDTNLCDPGGTPGFVCECDQFPPLR